jgi:hypothetical protein
LSESDNGPFYKGTFDEVAAQKYPLSRVIYFYDSLEKSVGKFRLRQFAK